MVSTSEDSVVIQKTRELCQSILEQDGFQSIKRQVDEFLADQTAQDHYQRVVEKANLLQQKQQGGMPMSGEEITEFEQDRSALLENTVAKGFLDAQDAMNRLQSSVNQYLTKTFELGRIPKAEDFDDGSCGSGCGCHH
jgi:cell fate (sporulation/competence/biofilm development) regulator YlbF (YheA/YmcA/DUF963 family)